MAFHLRTAPVPWPGGDAAQNQQQHWLQQREHRQQQPTPSSRVNAVVAQSRFVEGSMNDRASAAPPPGFLGPNEATMYEQQFYDYDRPKNPLRPISSAGHYQYPHPHQVQGHLPTMKQGPSRKGGFWDGVREKFRLTRSRSSGNIARAATAPIGEPLGGDVRRAAPVAYPTREEVMESYKSLVASGFFDAHAIQGTRHPLQTTTSHTDGRSSTTSPTSTTETALAAPLNLTAPKKAISRKYPPSSFSAVPYSTTRPSRPAELPTSMCPPPPPRRPATGSGEMMSSTQRGTKRGAAPLDRDSDANGGSSETGARKLVKKLRRSASRVSTELTGPSPGLISVNPFKPRPSTSSNAPTVASVVSAASDADDDPTVSAHFQRTPTKLTKAKQLPRSRGRGFGIGLGTLNIARRRPRSPPSVSTVTPDITVAPRRDLTPNPLTMNPVTASPPIFAVPLVDDAMLVDSPERRSRSMERMSMERPTTALTPPSFHYPQRKRQGEPLSVVPDSNRGIPSVPRIPAGFSVFGGDKGDVKMEGARDSGLGDDLENAVQVW